MLRAGERNDIDKGLRWCRRRKDAQYQGLPESYNRIQHLRRRGGTLLYVPSGVYLTDSFNLTSHMTLYLAQGAVIKATQGAPRRKIYELYSWRWTARCDHHCANGTIDGQGGIWWNMWRQRTLQFTRPNLVEFVNSNGILISNVTFRDSPFWNIHPVYCRFKLQCLYRRLVHFYRDDLVAVKSGWDEYGIAYGRPSSYITIRRVTGTTPFAGIAVGSETSGGVENVLAENIVLYNTGVGVNIKTNIGRGGFIKNITVSQVFMENVRTGIKVAGDTGDHPDNNFNPNALPLVNGVILKNIWGVEVQRAGSMQGLKDAPFTGICLSNVSYQGTTGATPSWKCSDVSGAAIEVSPWPCTELTSPQQDDRPVPHGHGDDDRPLPHCHGHDDLPHGHGHDDGGDDHPHGLDHAFIVGQNHVVAVRNKALVMEAWVQSPETFMETAAVLVTERKQRSPWEVTIYRKKTDPGQRDGSDAGGIIVVEIGPLAREKDGGCGCGLRVGFSFGEEVRDGSWQNRDDSARRYTRHITRPSWLSRVFPDESIEKPNLHVDDMKKLFNKKDGFTRMNDVDVVRVCLLLLLICFRGVRIWKATWTKLSSAFDDRKSLRGDGSKYTLSGFVWAFKIWIFEAFPSMRTYALKSSDDIPRAISWKRKRMLDWEDLIPYATINNPPLPPLREPSPHPEPSPDRPDYTPLQREPSPIPSHHRVSSPPSPHDRRPTKMPRLLSPCSPPPRDESRELRDEVNALREEIGTLRDNDGAWRVEVSTLRGEVAALREMVVSLQNERTDKVDALRRVFLARQSSRIRRRTRAIKSPYTPIVRRHRKKKPDSPIIPQESTPIVEEAPIIPRESPPTVQEATVIVEEVPPTIQEPDSHGVICRILEKPSDVPDMMDSSWLSYELPASTIPVSEEERKQLPDTILDNTLWAKTAVDFYLHERSKGCFTDICKLNDDIYLLLDRSWWGVLLGVEDNGYFDGGHIDAWVSRLLIIRKLKENKRNTRYTIMPTAFNAVHLKNQRDESFALGNGQAKLYPAWWEVDKVFIPVLERNHWLLVELQIPSLKAIVYDSMINYISLADLRDIIKGWSSYLAKYLDAINYWTRSGNKKPKKLNITVSRDETAPQQTKGPRGIVVLSYAWRWTV
ncbi:endo-glucanase 2 family protein [Hibiscus syriacus]|uniref:Endo-glucanase 2 family protein n=1 Tax=Hibiscus syriacus TaxID=106335 RepID=A0A6A2XAR4_HIBSY|nr:endo-glucanase 2 family protein [Hibiscus syriacus]